MSGWRSCALAVAIAALCLAPASAQQAASPPAAVSPPASAPADPLAGAVFGEMVTLSPHPALTLTDKVKWDDVYPLIARMLDQLRAIAKAQDLKLEGAPMTQFVSVSDDIAEITVMLPLAQPPGQTAAIAPASVGQTPQGQYYRFQHLGGYDTIGQTYDELANQLDEKNVEAEDRYIEEYVRDPATTKPIDLATFIYVAGKTSNEKTK